MNVAELLNEAGYLAHGYCLLWQPWLVALHAVPDLFIFLAYTSIPLTLLRLLKRRPDLAEYRGLTFLFSSFILLCGVTHLIGLVTLWFPLYAVHGTFKAITAIVSVLTAITIVPLVPQLANLPAPSQLRSLNARLRAEVESHEETLEQLHNFQKTLETRVVERTEELSVSNERLRVMTREAVHRSNNLLTQIQSLARQSAPKTELGTSWLTSFDGRVAAMARATELVLKSGKGWTANINDILRTELALHPHAVKEALSVEGPDFHVRTEAAQQVSLLIHELLDVSTRRGALSVATAQATLSWSLKGLDLVLRWHEEGVADWSRDLEPLGIEARLLLQSIPMTLSGKGRFIGDGQMIYEMTVPAEGLKPQDRTEAIDRVIEAYPRTPSRLAKPVQSE
jgi:two-component sensor histidine kinase